jgi:hypothetical protein
MCSPLLHHIKISHYKLGRRLKATPAIITFGMLEYWNYGIMDLKDFNRLISMQQECRKKSRCFALLKPNIPLFHLSIIPLRLSFNFFA